VDRLPIPSFLRDLDAEPGALRALFVAFVSLGAAGMNPTVTSPNLPNVQSIIRAQPEANSVILLVTLASAGLLFVGGILGDTNGRRGVLLGALAVLTLANLVGLVASSGPLFVGSRLVAAAAAYAVLPFALALVATSYTGLIRATAIGIAYVAYAGATAVSPVLLTLFGPSSPMWPAFAVAALVAAFALWFVWSRAPDLPALASDDRPYVVSTAVWAFAIVMISAGVVGFGDRISTAVRVTLVVIGLLLIAAYVVWDRSIRDRSRLRAHHVDRRPVTVAIAVGVVVSFAQAAPLFQLPLFFKLILDYGPLLATLATAPFIAALVIAGPLAGVLLTRFGPRILMAGGLATVGLGNIAAAAVIGQQVVYLAMAVSLALIGLGFVVATTVRTAVIFASVSRGLPATAAALNEASVLVGTRIGLATLTALITQRALDTYAASSGIADPGQREAAIANFRDVLVAAGTPGFAEVAASVRPAAVAGYVAAVVEAYRLSLFGTGLLALIAAPIMWLALGARDPLSTIWDHRDERAEAAQPSPG
jgi:MFS family permease